MREFDLIIGVLDDTFTHHKNAKRFAQDKWVKQVTSENLLLTYILRKTFEIFRMSEFIIRYKRKQVWPGFLNFQVCGGP